EHQGRRGGDGGRYRETQDVTPGTEITEAIHVDETTVLVERQHLERQAGQVTIRGHEEPGMPPQRRDQGIEDRHAQVSAIARGQRGGRSCYTQLPVSSGDGRSKSGEHAFNRDSLAQVDHTHVVWRLSPHSERDIASRLPERLPTLRYGL